MPAYKDKNGKWFAKFQYRDNGKPKTKLKRGFSTKRDAAAYERKFLEEYSPSADMSFGSLCSRFLDAKEAELRPTTLRGYQAVADSRFIEPIRDQKICDIMPVDILDIRTAMSKELNPSSVNLYMQRISTLFDFAVNLFDLKKNPCRGVGRLSAVDSEKIYLKPEDIEKLKTIPGVSEETKLLIDVLFWTGMRISEATALTVGDIQGDHIAVFKHKIRTKNGYLVHRGVKNNRGRNVMIHPRLQSSIRDYISKLYAYDEDTELFPRHHSSYHSRLARLFTIAGFEGASIHSLRHSHVALLIHLGYSPKLIADRIGDTVQTMLEVYAHIYPEDANILMSDLENVSNVYRNEP